MRGRFYLLRGSRGQIVLRSVPWLLVVGATIAFVLSIALPSQGSVSCFGKTATWVGTSGDDVKDGTSGTDVLVGGGGRDTIRGLGGNDFICGGDGADGLHGGLGADSIAGQGERDFINGADGDDTLQGGIGNDALYGAAGTDSITGGDGSDVCYGGESLTTCENGSSTSVCPPNFAQLFGIKSPSVSDDPHRLEVKQSCVTIEGQIVREPHVISGDGDLKYQVRIDRFISGTSCASKGVGDPIIIEHDPRDRYHLMKSVVYHQGDLIRLTGVCIADKNHNYWSEMHPVFATSLVGGVSNGTSGPQFGGAPMKAPNGRPCWTETGADCPTWDGYGYPIEIGD